MKTYEALERAGLALLSDVSNATVEVVGTRWGPQMEELTQHGMRPPTPRYPTLTSPSGLGVITDLSTAAIHMRSVGVR